MLKGVKCPKSVLNLQARKLRKGQFYLPVHIIITGLIFPTLSVAFPNHSTKIQFKKQ